MNNMKWEPFQVISEADEEQNENDKLISKLKRIEIRISNQLTEYQKNHRNITETNNYKPISKINQYHRNVNQQQNLTHQSFDQNNNRSIEVHKVKTIKDNQIQQKNQCKHKSKQQSFDQNFQSILQQSNIKENQSLKQKILNLQQKLYETKSVIDKLISQNEYIIELQQLINKKNKQIQEFKHIITIQTHELLQNKSLISKKQEIIQSLLNKQAIIEMNAQNKKYQNNLQNKNQRTNHINQIYQKRISQQNQLNLNLKSRINNKNYHKMHNGQNKNNETERIQSNLLTKSFKRPNVLMNRINKPLNINGRQVGNNKQNQLHVETYVPTFFSPEQHYRKGKDSLTLNKNKIYDYRPKQFQNNQSLDMNPHNSTKEEYYSPFQKTANFEQYKSNNKSSDISFKGRSKFHSEQSEIEEIISYLRLQNQSLKKKLFD